MNNDNLYKNLCLSTNVSLSDALETLNKIGDFIKE